VRRIELIIEFCCPVHILSQNSLSVKTSPQYHGRFLSRCIELPVACITILGNAEEGNQYILIKKDILEVQWFDFLYLRGTVHKTIIPAVCDSMKIPLVGP
jgi:hypothetical protein